MNKLRPLLREKALPVCIAIMWAGMLWSRALLSMGMVAFVGIALLVSGTSKAWQLVKHDRRAWALILLFIIPLLGFPWSDDKHAWWEALFMKAPFLALPFTMAAMRQVPAKSLRRAGWTVIILTGTSIVMTLQGYLAHAADVNESYLRGAVMRVPMDDDHVRYGWALSLVYLVVLCDALGIGRNMTGFGKRTAIIICVLLGAFILVLSSRTGILGAVVASVLLSWRVFGSRQRIVLLSSVIIVPLLAYALLPSLRNRVKFMVWDFQNYSRGARREGLNDAPRVISWQAALELIPEKPLTGTGFGGIRPRMQEWYAAKRPDMPAYERLVPSNEWLFHGVASGIPGMILFTFAIMLAYRRRSGDRMWTVAWWISVIGFLYETGLEVQHGIFLFSFFMVWSVAWEGREQSE